MLVVEGRFLRLDALDVWWPLSADAVMALVSRAPIVTVMQCSTQIADALGSLTFHRRPFPTTVLDLSVPEETLWSRLDQRSCRTEINRGKRLECSVSINERPNDALRLINDFVQRREYRAPLSEEEWRQTLACGDVFVAHYQGQPAATHVVRVDGKSRARVLVGATLERGEKLSGSVIGALNRYLLWYEMGHYRGCGVRFFDLGGITLDEDSPLYSITRFKLSFGGSVLEENVVRLAGNRALRLSLRAMARAKLLMDGARRGWKRSALAARLRGVHRPG